MPWDDALDDVFLIYISKYLIWFYDTNGANYTPCVVSLKQSLTDFWEEERLKVNQM